MNKKRLKNSMGEIGHDIITAFVIVAVIMLSLYAYCGIWPPMVVIESGSMEHPPDAWTKKSYVGIIDTGDMVFVKTVNASYGKDVVTYVQGEATGHSTYGGYGDVVIYRPNGLKNRNDGTPVIPIIHRLVVWLDVNTTRVNPDFNGIDFANYSFDVPSLGIYDSTDTITITNYGYQHETVTIKLDRNSGLMRYYEGMNIIPHGGYITMGDNNAPLYDQPLSGGYEPVLPEWIIGKAWGELPWFGAIKLWASGSNIGGVAPNSWTGLIGTIVVLLLFPLALDFVIPKIKKSIGKRKNSDYEEELATPEESVPPKDGLPPPGELHPSEVDASLQNEKMPREEIPLSEEETLMPEGTQESVPLNETTWGIDEKDVHESDNRHEIESKKESS